MQQIKKDPNDPDWDQINPEIVKMAHTNGFVRQPFTLFLAGEMTWREALEAMTILLYGQFKETQTLCTEILETRPQTALMLSSTAGHLLKALPSKPFGHED